MFWFRKQMFGKYRIKKEVNESEERKKTKERKKTDPLLQYLLHEKTSFRKVKSNIIDNLTLD